MNGLTLSWKVFHVKIDYAHHSTNFQELFSFYIMMFVLVFCWREDPELISVERFEIHDAMGKLWRPNWPMIIIDIRKLTKLAFCKNKFFPIHKISPEFSKII